MTMNAVSGLIFLLLALAASACPGSKAILFHAKCSLTVNFPSASCSDVASEIQARVNGVNGWYDPHNKGTYSLEKGEDDYMLIKRVTGNKKYTDLLDFTFKSTGSASCSVSACSESQVTSKIDFSTNYCNLHDLFCGSAAGCKTVTHDLSFTESFKDCSQHDASQCLAVAGATPSRAIASSSIPRDVDFILREVSASSAPTYGADLVTFDGAKKTTWKWRELNDPVMGGLSKATFSVDSAAKAGIFNGTVAIVPSLKAPGFCNAETMDGLGVLTRGEDMSAYTHLLLKVRTTTPNYQGFKVSLAADTINPQFNSFKANFQVPAGDAWQTVAVPFASFSNDWSAFTGDCNTTDPNGKTHKCCGPQHPEVCITKKNLGHISQVGLWAEGHAGEFHLEVERIGGGTLSSAAAVVPQVQVASQTAATTDGAAGEIAIDSFDAPVHEWKQMNDPVMGGKSTGTFSVSNGVGIFDGEVVDVPFLKAPGFITVRSSDSKPFPDLTACSALAFTARAGTNYSGFKVSFGTAHPPEGKFFARGYKAPFSPPAGGAFGEVVIPFTQFSDLWDDATGKIIKSCAQDAKYCPDAKALRDLKTISFWGEGVAGKVHLEIKRVYATGCKAGAVAGGLAATAGDSSGNKCCAGRCQKPGEEKYWSIASGIFGKKHCGECCMDPKKYNLFHFFEKNLTKSDQDSPCAAFGFTEYDSTVTHGFGPVKMTLDLYNLPGGEQRNEL